MIRLKFLFLSLFLIAATTSASAQSIQFDIELQPVTLPGFEGIHSFAWGKWENYILLLGGRTDGLHRRQPFAAFHPDGNNISIRVIDLKTEKVVTRSLNDLPPLLADQLQSTNMQFHQDSNRLVLTGGYGYSQARSRFMTYPLLTTIRVKEFIEALLENKDVLPFIQFTESEMMAVTGGRLNKLGEYYYLVGGQRFDGRYNPHGPNHGPGFSQQYVNGFKKFKLQSAEERFTIEDYQLVYDSLLLHRRDYNLLPQLDENGTTYLSVYSGVFRYDKDLPFTSVVDLKNDIPVDVPVFEQKFNHYHSATLSVYSMVDHTQYSIFFGGIAQFYLDSNGETVQDNDVPFTDVISVVERKKESIREYALPLRMPGFLGASAEFIPAADSLFNPQGVLMLPASASLPFAAGYIIGGLESTVRNAFWTNNATATNASAKVWKVWIKPK